MVKTTPTPIGAALVWLMCWLWAGSVWAAKIEVSLDRNPVAVGESFTLTFAAEGAPDEDPDFGPLQQDFEVLGQSQSNQFSLNNGHASRRIEWQITVMAKHAGALQVPPIAFGSDQSPPLSVTVTDSTPPGHRANHDEDIFIEVDAQPKNPYVQAQVVYTVRVLGRVRFNGELSSPEAGDALVEQLDADRNYAIDRHGVQYTVFERRFAIFPQKSGPLPIGALHLKAQVDSGSGFNPFFGRAPRISRIDSEPVTLDVRPIPKQFTGTHWLPASALQLEDSWANNPPKITAGEPVTRTLSLKAKGATVGVLPELNASPDSTGDIKRYPDQPAIKEEQPADGVVSSRQEKTALIIAKPGTYQLPALEIPWWNTRTDRLEIARIPERTLTVAPSAASPAPTPQVTPAPAPQPTPAPATTPAPAPTAATENLWFWLTWVCGVGWLATAAVWGWQSRRQGASASPAPESATVSEHGLIAAIKRACQNDDALAAKRALSAWATRRGFAVDNCGGELGREIARLNRTLYGREANAAWRGEALWQSFQAYTADDNAGNNRRAGVELEPLYKRV